MGTFVSLFSLAQVTSPSFAAARLFARRQSSEAFSNCGEFSSVKSYHANPSRRQRNDNTEDGPDYPCRRRRRALTGVHATQGGWVRPFDHRRRPLRFRERPHHGHNTTGNVTHRACERHFTGSPAMLFSPDQKPQSTATMPTAILHGLNNNLPGYLPLQGRQDCDAGTRQCQNGAIKNEQRS